MIGIALALGIAAWQDPGTAVPGVTADGWEWLADAVDFKTAVFARPARQPRHVWMRYELAPRPDNDLLSARILVEFDCAGWRTRWVQGSMYDGRNLTGDMEAVTPGQWEYAAPETFDEFVLEYACGEP